MLEIKVVGTGSKGNLYLLKNSDNRVLILECGISYREWVNRATMSNVDGCIISHSHTDHNKKLKNGIYQSEYILENYGIDYYCPENIEIEKEYKVGDFKVKAYLNNHNVVCYSYVIESDGVKVLFTTDTSMIPNVDEEIDYFFVEVNYCEKLIQDKVNEIDKNNVEMIHYVNVWRNHNSLESTKMYFDNLGYKPKGIITLHLSNSGLGDSEMIEKEMSAYSDFVKVAKKNDIYRFDKEMIRKVEFK